VINNRIRFSLRFAMLALFGLSLALGYLRFREVERQKAIAERNRRRLAAITEIDRGGGDVNFRTRGGSIPELEDDNVRLYELADNVYFANAKLTPQVLAQLAEVPEVKFISFNSSDFADKHVAYLDVLTSLRELQVNGTKITNSGLAHIAQRHQLELLTINDTTVDDRSLDTLTGMKTLRKLHIRHTPISTAGEARLRAELPSCVISR